MLQVWDAYVYLCIYAKDIHHSYLTRMIYGIFLISVSSSAQLPSGLVAPHQTDPLFGQLVASAAGSSPNLPIFGE